MGKMPGQSLRRLLSWVAIFTITINGCYALLLAASHQPQERFLEPFIFDGVHFGRNVLLVAGLVLLYLAVELKRRSVWAWRFSVMVLAVVVVISATRRPFLVLAPVPLISLVILILERKYFDVASETSSISQRFLQVGVVISGLYLYTVAGLWLMSRRDLGIYIGLFESQKHAVLLLCNGSVGNLTIHSRHAKLFIDSINLARVVAIILAIGAFFRPLQPRSDDQTLQRGVARQLLEKYGGSSEDFFKLWPEDKLFFFHHDSGLAYKVVDGLAMILGDPIGKPADFESLLLAFLDLARRSRWNVSLVHIGEHWLKLYKKHDFAIQKIGEEAVVSIDQFMGQTSKDKHWRNISNRFAKAGYTVQTHQPPHSAHLLGSLKSINDSWLAKPGRTERTFTLGYFDTDYLNSCPIMVAYDAQSQPVAFVNMIHSYDPSESNIDLFRHSVDAPSNINDFILKELIGYLSQNSAAKNLNLGLCPLKGVGDDTESKRGISAVLKLFYDNGDKVYPFSFKGLVQFKSKFDPSWRSRYLAVKTFPGYVLKIPIGLNKVVALDAEDQRTPE